MNDVVKFLNSPVLTGLASIGSIMGLFMTIWVLRKLRRIHRNFLFQARFPDLKKKIARHRSNLSKLLTSYGDSADQVQVELKKCQSDLGSLRPKVSRSLKADIRHLVRNIKDIGRSSSHPPKELIREIYMSLVFLEQELENLSEDMKWGPKE